MGAHIERKLIATLNTDVKGYSRLVGDDRATASYFVFRFTVDVFRFTLEPEGAYNEP
jgi:hypothetical protein